MTYRIVQEWMPAVILLTLVAGFSNGCAPVVHDHEHVTESSLVPTDHGTVTLDGLYEFEEPTGWKLIRDLGDGETVFMFFKLEEGEHPSQTSIFYNNKVYGTSRDLETRVRQFNTYFLAGRGIKMNIISSEPGVVDGREALVVHLQGDNPYRNEKAKAVAYFYKTGQFIVSLACTQWRTMDADFDPGPFQTFENFTKSFKYVKAPFYEEIEQRIKKLEGQAVSTK